VVAGKYRIERVAGEGAMGAVFVAHHLVLDQRVALKFLFVDDPQTGGETAERFVREAQASARLRSDHVVRVTDAGSLDGGVPFLVMEYLEGCDLAELLRLQGPLAPADVADYALQVCAALAEAHAAGIVHRDLKPANLFLAARGDDSSLVKILDFGISKQRSERAQWRELTGKMVLGTPAYISPEQLRSSKNVDARADIWSLGVAMYELLSGTLPFDGETPGELFAAILEQAPVPLRSRNAQLPAEWDALVARCLRRDPAARYEHVGALAHALAPLGSGRRTHLLAGIDEALTRSVRSIPRTDNALVKAAVQAAAASLPPPPSCDPIAVDVLATDKTLLAHIVTGTSASQGEAGPRWPARLGAPIAVALALVVATVALIGKSARAPSARGMVVAAEAAAAAVEVSEDRTESPEPIPALTSTSIPTSTTTQTATATPKRKAPQAAPKKPSSDARPKFLRDWR
jgi:serine/threonine-protein kinase